MTIAAAILYALASGSVQATPAPTQVPAPTTAPASTAAAPTASPPNAAPDDQTRPADTGPTTDRADPNAYDLGETSTVSAAKPRGSVQGNIPPDVVLTAAQLQAYGATNIAELLTALEPLTQSSRGRGGGGMPVVLINGRRTSGFNEIRNIPFEAIERTEILPEEVALTYGYSADQRVVNIVLKAGFRQAAAQLSLRGPTEGGRLTTDGQGNFFQIQGANRISFQLEQQHDTALYESERDIVRSPGATPFDLTGNISGAPYGTNIAALTALAGRPVTVAAVPNATNPTLAQFAGNSNVVATDDLTANRTLLPRADTTTLTGSITRDLDETTKGTLSLNLVDASTTGFSGLAGLTLAVPSTNAASPFAQTINLYRYVDDPDALRRDGDSLTGNIALMLDGYLNDNWRYTVTGTYDRVDTKSTTGRGFDSTALQAGINAGTVNPFSTLPSTLLTPLTDTARSVAAGGNLESVFTGNLYDLPAGQLQSTFKFGLDTRSIDSESVRSGVYQSGNLGRDRYYGTMNFNIPIASRDREVLGWIGDLGLNFNAGYDHASDFGGLTSVGIGANWSPRDPVSFTVSYTDEQGAPTIQQLNDPTVSTPNVAVYDYATNQTVNITQITGGNRNLGSDDRQVFKFGVNLRPMSSQDLTFNSTYTWQRTDDAISSFPTITAALEAAIPERFTRDATGRLISIDARPINYESTEKADLRTGFNFSRAFGKPNASAASGPMGMMMMGGGPRPGGSGGPPPGGGGQMRMSFGGGPGGGGGRRGGGSPQLPGQGRFNISVYHTYRFTDEITIRNGLPILDQLNGASTSATGGTPKNEIQVQAGAFRNGFGGFLNANWREGTFVDGGLTGQDLFFGARTTVNLNLFVDFNQRAELIAKYPLLKGARLSLGVGNLFDQDYRVRAASGDLPLNYQPDFLDPQGRTFNLTFRKILF